MKAWMTQVFDPVHELKDQLRRIRKPENDMDWEKVGERYIFIHIKPV